MANLFLVPIDLSDNELRNALAQILGADPTGVEAKFIYNSTSKTFKFYNGTAWITLGRLDQISAPTNDVSLNSQKITNLAAPSSDNDAARKKYVDDAITTLTNAVNAAVRGLAWKDSVRAASTADVDLADAPAALDGVTLVTNDRVLIKDQADASENGIYVFHGTGNPFTRAVDADATDEIEAATVMVEEGTANANTAWTQIEDGVTVGSDDQTWVQFGSGSTIGAGDGLVLNAGNFDVNPGQGIEIVADAVTAKLGDGLHFDGGDAIEVFVGEGLELDAGKVQIEDGGILRVEHGGTGADNADDARANLGVVNALRYAEDIGDGIETDFDVVHSLNTLDVLVQVVRVSDGLSVFADVTRTDVDTVNVAFAVAPSADQYRVTIVA